MRFLVVLDITSASVGDQLRAKVVRPSRPIELSLRCLLYIDPEGADPTPLTVLRLPLSNGMANGQTALPGKSRVWSGSGDLKSRPSGMSVTVTVTLTFTVSADRHLGLYGVTNISIDRRPRLPIPDFEGRGTRTDRAKACLSGRARGGGGDAGGHRHHQRVCVGCSQDKGSISHRDLPICHYGFRYRCAHMGPDRSPTPFLRPPFS